MSTGADTLLEDDYVANILPNEPHTDWCQSFDYSCQCSTSELRPEVEGAAGEVVPGFYCYGTPYQEVVGPDGTTY